nr:immunoglobulin light chain junction region [Macaca mulatta]MOX47859.1 immunoglobulin light chain junction region [Macaca mulatta]MOX48332.1 immunoglobulin light chain junction region [Macaca mulatta]MOX48855.1 immunoglobulin light chain junction region [Macaca mulatta]MOX49541.1 immunoglobulin light chain junction region [Macaca mulatta]
CLQTKNSPYSF